MATDIDGPLPELDLAAGTTITVTLDDASAKITKLNVYGYTPERTEDVQPEPFVPMYVYGPGP